MDNDNTKKDNRREKRIPISYLPEFLRTVKLNTHSLEFTATTIDASNHGMAVVIFGFTENTVIEGADAIIKITSKDVELSSTINIVKIIYIKEVENNLLRVGVEFKKGNSLKKYQELLKEKIY